MVTDRTDRVVIAIIVAWAAVMVALLLSGCDVAAAESTWPESAEFSQLPSGQDRFSEHGTNLSRYSIVVDHRTGAQYLVRHGRNEASVCPLLAPDGTPLLIDEAGS